LRRSASEVGAWPWTRRRARLASWRVGDDRAVHHRCDLLERHPEDIVEHERQSFRRFQLLEDDEQRQADRVGEHGGLLGPFGLAADRAENRIRYVHVEGILPARRSRA
jgi:hypothetical protein